MTHHFAIEYRALGRPNWLPRDEGWTQVNGRKTYYVTAGLMRSVALAAAYGKFRYIVDTEHSRMSALRLVEYDQAYSKVFLCVSFEPEVSVKGAVLSTEMIQQHHEDAAELLRRIEELREEYSGIKHSLLLESLGRRNADLKEGESVLGVGLLSAGQLAAPETTWDCDDKVRNVYGLCVYDDYEDSAHDFCIFCHGPEERK